ncbi:uncharacterized protein AtWU_09917 [Aspergillus tubingensis]|uniref:uncharacterized protein n=1 Tax=Aspergillus tubingensis TaxID=5068 RepID=UPI00157A0AEA|nr:uncharacterized protein AtWU_09917 [Aspergillus tubingensis]GFN20112.1 hypothetical protein AtWU_09917 [Aspergillus tubingensis]
MKTTTFSTPLWRTYPTSLISFDKAMKPDSPLFTRHQHPSINCFYAPSARVPDNQPNTRKVLPGANRPAVWKP